MLKKRNRGYGILVSAVPKESNAFFSLKDTLEVMTYISSIQFCLVNFEVNSFGNCVKVQEFLQCLVEMAHDDAKIHERSPEPSEFDDDDDVY